MASTLNIALMSKSYGQKAFGSHDSEHHYANKPNKLSSSSSDHLPDNPSPFVLMDKLYSKSSHMKSWNELTKCMKQSLLEKRPIAVDSNERYQLQKCLDTIQKNIEVKSVQSMVERLDTICRQLKLKFNFTQNYECFVHSEMYYVEIKLDMETGQVLDCKVAHQDEALSCSELIDVLQKGNFTEFTKHLQGLSAIYQIDGDKKIKAKTYMALNALETDLVNLSELQKNQINDINNLVHKSPAGVLEPRKGGYPMKLTFFVPPYDLIDLKSKTTLPLTVETIMERKLGYSATVCIEESSTPHKLQIESLITVKITDGKNLPQFSTHTSSNTNQLPACFALKLAKPLPLCLDLAKKISKVTGIEFPNINQQSNLITLLAKQNFTNFEVVDSQSFYAVLPDQNHCYYINGNSENISGILIDKIPFTHPTHVPRILVYLRQQVLFNVIAASIIRQIEEIESNCYIFEISTSGLSNIYVQFEHPVEQSLATMDVDLKDITNVKCKLYPNFLTNICADDYASKIMQKSLSIPVTMRSIINRSKVANRAAINAKKDSSTSSSSNVANEQNVIESNLAGNSNAGNLISNSGNIVDQQQQQQHNTNLITTNNNNKQNKFQQSLLYMTQQLQYSKNSNNNNNQQQQQQISLAQQQQLLSKANQAKQAAAAAAAAAAPGNTMLMSMLSDIPHAALGGSKQSNNKKRKRLSSGDIVANSPKRRFAQKEVKGEQQQQQDYESVSASKLSSSGELSSSSISSSDNDLSIDGNNSNSNQYYSIKSGDDGHNEQLKIIKSLEEISQKEDLPKLILKNEKLSNIKISKSQKNVITIGSKSDMEMSQKSDFIEHPFRKERKRKRNDMIENKDSGISVTITSGASSNLSDSVNTSNSNISQKSQLSQVVSSSSSGLTKLISQSGTNLTPPKLKKSLSVSSPSTQNMNKNIQITNNLALKYSQDKHSSMINKVPKSSSLSMLSSSKMSEFEVAAAAAVAASSGGSAAVAAAAAVAAVSNSFDPKRFVKPVKAKTSGNNPNNSSSGNSGGTKSPITLSVSPSSSTVASRLKDLGKVPGLTATLKQKSSLSSASITSSSSLGSGLSSPKQIQQTTQSQPILQASSTALAAASVSSATGAALAQKNLLQKPPGKKGSLTAVVDRLRQNAADGSSSVSPGSSVSVTQASTSPEISSASSNNRTDISSSTSSSKSSAASLPSSKSNAEIKAKYFRNDQQFTIKQSNSGLKMSITKTKAPTTLSASSAADLLSKIGPGGTGLFKSSTNTKYTIPKIAKSSSASSSSSSSTTTVSANSVAITSPTLSSTSSASVVVGSSSSSPSKKVTNPNKTNVPSSTTTSSLASKSHGNNSKSVTSPLNSSTGIVSPAGKSNANFSSGVKVSPKNSGQSRGDKVFKNPEPPSPSFNKQNPLAGGLQSQPPSNNSRPNISTALFKNNTFMPMNQSWPPNSAGGDSTKTSVTSSDMYNLDGSRAANASSVSSSSDISSKNLPTSTPSSPIESSPIGDLGKTQPLIIPTEAIDIETASSKTIKTRDDIGIKDIDSSMSDYSNRLVSADSSSTNAPPIGDLYSADSFEPSMLGDSGMLPKRKLSDQLHSDLALKKLAMQSGEPSSSSINDLSIKDQSSAMFYSTSNKTTNSGTLIDDFHPSSTSQAQTSSFLNNKDDSEFMEDAMVGSSDV